MVTPIPPASPVGGPVTRQKRVLPARSRRGGPGLGNSEVDIIILDSLKRKGASTALMSPGLVFAKLSVPQPKRMLSSQQTHLSS
jgi:hypothetical protein